MTTENNSGQEQVLQQVFAKFDVLADRLLANSVKHNKVWQRSIFSIDSEKTEQVYGQFRSSSLGVLLEDREGFSDYRGPNKIPMDTRNPVNIAITVEKFGPYPGVRYQYKELKLIFNYKDMNDQDYCMAVGLRTDHEEIFSYIYQPHMFETGYDGSDHKRLDVDYERLKFLYELLQQNTQGNQVKEKTLDEQLANQKMINEDTGATFYFDPNRRNYFSKDGVAMGDDKSPLGNLPPKHPALKVMGAYGIQELEEGEQNPFIK
jgi:hypothetical protein